MECYNLILMATPLIHSAWHSPCDWHPMELLWSNNTAIWKFAGELTYALSTVISPTSQKSVHIILNAIARVLKNFEEFKLVGNIYLSKWTVFCSSGLWIYINIKKLILYQHLCSYNSGQYCYKVLIFFLLFRMSINIIYLA